MKILINPLVDELHDVSPVANDSLYVSHDEITHSSLESKNCQDCREIHGKFLEWVDSQEARAFLQNFS